MFAHLPLSMQSTTVLCLCALVYVSVGSSTLKSSAPDVVWSRPQFKHADDVANTPEALKRRHKKVYFDACSAFVNKSQPTRLKSQWTIYHLDVDNHRAFMAARITTLGCKLEWTAPREGDYALRVLVYNGKRKFTQRILSFFVRDLWIVVAGDGFASGQGNPDEAQRLLGAIPAKYHYDSKCQRSGHSFAVKLFDLINANDYPFHGLLMTFVACQGATVKGMIEPQANASLSQLDQIGQLMEATRVERLIKQLSTVRHPDAIVISIGGDDLHLADAIRSIIVGSPQPLLRSANATLDQVEHSLNELGAAIHDMRIDPRTIMLMEYYDVFRDEYGRVSAECPSAGLATSANFLAAEELIRRPFNKILAAAAVRNEWTYVDGIDEVFATHGLCSPSSMIVGFDESLNRQGNVLGAFYPNNKGHELVAQVLWQVYLRPHLQQVAGLP